MSLFSLLPRAKRQPRKGFSYPKPWSGVLVDNGTFLPSTTPTAEVTAYKAQKTGWLIHYGMNVYHGHYWEQLQKDAFNPPPATSFNIADVNVAAWAEYAATKGIDYAGLTIINEYGFCLYPSEAVSPMANITLTTSPSGQQSPFQPLPYCAPPGSDQNIVTKFVNEFRARGIEPMAYICFFTQFNIMDGAINQAGIPAGRLTEYVDYYKLLIQELMVKYDFKYMWFDYAGTMPAGTCQQFYNAAKSINPNCVVIGNAIGETNFSRFPYDIGSVEEYAIYGGNTSNRQTTQTHGGTTYYCPREIVATPYGDFSQWYYIDDLCPVQPQYSPFDGVTPYVKMQAQPIAEFQGIVDEARTYGNPFIHAMMPDRNGVLVPEILAFLDQIDFT